MSNVDSISSEPATAPSPRATMDQLTAYLAALIKQDLAVDEISDSIPEDAQFLRDDVAGDLEGAIEHIKTAASFCDPPETISGLATMILIYFSQMDDYVENFAGGDKPSGEALLRLREVKRLVRLIVSGLSKVCPDHPLLPFESLPNFRFREEPAPLNERVAEVLQQAKAANSNVA